MAGQRRQLLRFLTPLPLAVLLCIAALLGNLTAVADIGLFAPYAIIIVLWCFTVAGVALHLAWRAKVPRAAILLAGFGSLLIWALPMVYDGVTFVLWLPFHTGELRKISGADQTISHWDAWGFATVDNDSFLVADRDDALSTAIGARAWQGRRRTTCEVLAARRMMPNIYIAITDGCSP